MINTRGHCLYMKQENYVNKILQTVRYESKFIVSPPLDKAYRQKEVVLIWLTFLYYIHGYITR